MVFSITNLVDVQFFMMDVQFFYCRLLLSYKLCMFLLLDYLHPGNYAFVLREAPRLSMCKVYTGHVQDIIMREIQ